MRVSLCLFGTLSCRVGALQISIIIISVFLAPTIWPIVAAKRHQSPQNPSFPLWTLNRLLYGLPVCICVSLRWMSERERVCVCVCMVAEVSFDCVLIFASHGLCAPIWRNSTKKKEYVVITMRMIVMAILLLFWQALMDKAICWHILEGQTITCQSPQRRWQHPHLRNSRFHICIKRWLIMLLHGLYIDHVCVHFQLKGKKTKTKTNKNAKSTFGYSNLVKSFTVILIVLVRYVFVTMFIIIMEVG